MHASAPSNQISKRVLVLALVLRVMMDGIHMVHNVFLQDRSQEGSPITHGRLAKFPTGRKNTIW
jgi:hypothetical protein